MWFTLEWLANREQENGALIFCVRQEEICHIIVEEGQPSRPQVLGIRRQVDPAADGTRFQLDGPVAAVLRMRFPGMAVYTALNR